MYLTQLLLNTPCFTSTDVYDHIRFVLPVESKQLEQIGEAKGIYLATSSLTQYTHADGDTRATPDYTGTHTCTQGRWQLLITMRLDELRTSFNVESTFSANRGVQLLRTSITSSLDSRVFPSSDSRGDTSVDETLSTASWRLAPPFINYDHEPLLPPRASVCRLDEI